MPDVEFSNVQEQILRQTTINAEHPGTILHDFEVMLDYLGADGVKAGGKYNLLPIDAIATLDARLSRPLRLDLQRPQLKSHPYLQGLHLLLRATGLTRVEGVGDKARLCIVPTMAEQWNRLNPTEQYFTLLEAGFVHGNGEMIGESNRGFKSSTLMAMRKWQSLPKKGVRSDSSKPSARYFLSRNLYLLALADLFGLVRVEHPSKPAAPWSPLAVYLTPFGDAVLRLLIQRDMDDFLFDEETLPFGVWQPIFQPCFPEWRENLVLPTPTVGEGVFVFKVSLGRIWRRIAIPHTLTLHYLAYAILSSVDFSSDHLFEFSFRDRLGRLTAVNHPECEDAPFTDEFLIGALPLAPGQSMTFLFDFGDNWEFHVKLEKIDPANARMKKPQLLAEQGEAPEQYPEYEE